MKAYLTNLAFADQSEFGYEDQQFKHMIDAFENEQEVVVLDVACIVDADDPASNYYDVKLANGVVLEALSADHLVPVGNWSVA